MNGSDYSDSTTKIDELKKLIVKFSADRNWEEYHTPKNLASSVAIEAAELMECFQWLTPEESFELKNDLEKKKAVAEEICDVASYLLNLCAVLEIDLASEFVRKLKKSALKYPISENK